MVPGAGIEPARLAAGDFESCGFFIFGAALAHLLGAKIAKMPHSCNDPLRLWFFGSDTQKKGLHALEPFLNI
ncbi:hypothetical protein DZC30_05150 [Comamonas testosteroni]|uniref:Uncharacterized protein n=1 Tax=Comamonas testosteroni TaxID=285 RepID=A0A373FRM4_COMTE|nr:hypothetical protein DZC30_05150 [Comamonas testosteroni]